MAQKSELKHFMHDSQPLVLFAYREILLITSDIAGLFPSVIVSYLQDSGRLRMGRTRIQGDDLHELEINQCEVMVVDNTMAKRYIFIPSWFSKIPYFEQYDKELLSVVSRLRGIVIISLDIRYSLSLCLFDSNSGSCKVGSLREFS